MSTAMQAAQGAIHDFDFLAGTWVSRQRRLKARLQGCDDWESFSAHSCVQLLPGGIANFDTLVAEAWRPGWEGMTMRIFNPVTQLWSIYWLTNEGGGIDAATGVLSPPVVGRFQGDEGIFEGDDAIDGRAIRVRFRWQRQGKDRARWEQAFSADGGGEWETNWVMEFERVAEGASGAGNEAPHLPAAEIDAQVVELRRYTLHPGQRDTLIELFDREFVESQEAAGIAVLGQFREPAAPDRFVWLRGFAAMEERARALSDFYRGPVWQQHRDAANATMIDSDNVLLLRPAWAGAGIAAGGRTRARGSVRMAQPGLFDLGIFYLREPASPALLHLCRETMLPCLQRAGATVLGCYVSEPAPNNFPRLPVREGELVLVVLAAFDDAAAFESFVSGGSWAREVAPALAAWLARPMESHRLVPTARSAMHR